jgi:hypothetical protein
MPNYFSCSICYLQLDMKHKIAFFIQIGTHESFLQIKWPSKCGQNDCTKTFSNRKLYKVHLSSHVSYFDENEN